MNWYLYYHLFGNNKIKQQQYIVDVSFVVTPNLVTVTEVLPKEKKQKEEKTAQLGQCTVDLLPLVKGRG